MIDFKIEERVYALRSRYGELLSLEELAEVFKYPSIDAVRKANWRGTLPVKLYRFPKKNGLYARVIDVAVSIERMSET